MSRLPVQGRTGPLEQLPGLLKKGLYISLGKTGVFNIISPVDRNTVMWALSFRAPQTKAAELNTLFKDPAAAQVSLSRWCTTPVALFVE